jgi:hypothetical protein
LRILEGKILKMEVEINNPYGTLSPTLDSKETQTLSVF